MILGFKNNSVELKVQNTDFKTTSSIKVKVKRGGGKCQKRPNA